MFNALLNLYQSHSSNTPLERFTTEAFCGVLRSDSALLESFLRKFAGIENETGFNIFPEKPYPYNGSNPRIDVVFENKNYLIFLEIKVDSPEGERDGVGQLEVYADILKHQNKKVILLFCTKYLETKDKDLYKPIKFKQFLWRNFYKFLLEKNQTNQNHLSNEFLNYLERQKMSKAPELSIDDLSAMQRLNSILKTLDECFYHIRPKFEEYFGAPLTHPLDSNKQPIINKGEILNQIMNHNRHAIWRYILDHGHIITYFYFGNKEVKPIFNVYFWAYKDGKYYKEIKRLVNIEVASQNNKDDDSALIMKDGDWFGFGYEKALENFIKEEDQFNTLESWCISQLERLHQFMIRTKSENNIPWQIKI